MNTPLQNVSLTTNEIASSMVEADTQEQGAGELAHHIHMPNPSLWPLMTGIAAVSSSEWSAHPVKVEIEQEGVVLALYGKVELEAQRKELEEKLLRMPGVIDVKNFIVAEDTILNAINARIEKLKADGKLQGAKNIQALVENYIVHLYGETPTPQMKYLLERELVGIPGVRVVVNHIGLNEDIPGNLGKTKNR